jgi:hypothetical protein
MTWGKIDDQLAFHPKALEAGNEALGMWVRSMSYSCQMLTGGFISNEIVLAMGGPKIAAKLVQARLWEIVDGGYQFHDWEQYQPCAETEKAKREETRKARSEAGKLGANARWNSKDKPESMAKGMANGMANAMANAWQNDAPEPEPNIKTHLTSANEIRDDIEQLCNLLSSSMKDNGVKRHAVTDGWRNDARLLLDRDKRPLDAALRVLRWSQDSSFWRMNIHSMSKFREKYDRLKMQMESETTPTNDVDLIDNRRAFAGGIDLTRGYDEQMGQQ